MKLDPFIKNIDCKRINNVKKNKIKFLFAEAFRLFLKYKNSNNTKIKKPINAPLLLKSNRGKYKKVNNENTSRAVLLFSMYLLKIKNVEENIISKSDPLCGSNLSEIDLINSTTLEGKPNIEKK